jgi:hypothetical protein
LSDHGSSTSPAAASASAPATTNLQPLLSQNLAALQVQDEALTCV